MEFLFCLGGTALVGAYPFAVAGLGWLVIQPLGRINQVRISRPRFQLLDLFWLAVLLQPPIALFSALIGSRASYSLNWPIVITIFVLIWGVTIVGWAVTTGVLTEAGVIHSGKRAVAVLVLLPMITFVVPFAIVFIFFETIALLGSYGPPHWQKALSCVLVDSVFVLAVLGCRQLSRWIASGASELPEQVRAQGSKTV